MDHLHAGLGVFHGDRPVHKMPAEKGLRAALRHALKALVIGHQVFKRRCGTADRRRQPAPDCTLTCADLNHSTAGRLKPQSRHPLRELARGNHRAGVWQKCIFLNQRQVLGVDPGGAGAFARGQQLVRRERLALESVGTAAAWRTQVCAAI